MVSTSISDSIFTPAEQESMALVEIDPAELCVDWEVNDAHVETIVQSLPSHGGKIVFPPYVCLHNRKIIDGLHRVVAAERAGLTSIRIVLVDVSETRFWDLRIMAAKPHVSVENSRLYAWMESCWEADWGKGSTRTRSDIAESLWQLFRVENYRQTQSLYTKLDRAKLQGEQAEIYDWFLAKSSVWSIPVESLADRILAAWDVKPAPQAPAVQPAKPIVISPAIEEVAAKYSLTIPARTRLHTEVRNNPTIKPTYVEKWVDAQMPAPLLDFAKEVKREKVERKKERTKQRDATPIAQKQVERRKFATVRDAINSAGDSIRRVSGMFPDVPEAASLLAAHSEMVNSYLQKMIETGGDDVIARVLAENARLHHERAKLEIEVASLKRSAGTKTTVPESTIAWSSAQL